MPQLHNARSERRRQRSGQAKPTMRIGDDVRLDIPSLMNTRSDTILSCHRGLATPDR